MCQSKVNGLFFVYDLYHFERKIVEKIVDELVSTGNLEAKVIFDPTPSDVLEVFT